MNVPRSPADGLGVAPRENGGRGPEAEDGATVGRVSVAAGMRWRWRVWAPLAVLFLALVVLRAGNWRAGYESQFLVLACNFVFCTLASVFIAYLAGRSFLMRGSLGVLLLGCGVVAWGAAGVVANSVSRGDANLDVTIHNCGVWISAFCHLAGAVLVLRPGARVRTPGPWLGAGYIGALGAVGLGAIWAVNGHPPVFFVRGEGGTLVRQFVLGSAVAMFLVAAGLVARWSRRAESAFPAWYVGALVAIALGLTGILIQSTIGGLVPWVGRVALWLGGVYMVLAALASAREASVWGIGLEEALRENQARLAAFGAATFEGLVESEAGRILDCNEQLAGMFGYTVAELKGRAIADLVAPEDRERVMAHILRNRESVIEHACLHRDGTRGMVEARGRPVGAGSARRFTALRDITERKRAEEALRANQKVLEEDLAIAIRLRDLSTQLINGGGEQEIYERMLETAMAVMAADFASMQVLTEAAGSRELRLLAWKNFHAESARFWEMVAAGSTSACGAALERGERIVITDVERCEFMAGTRDLEEYRRSGIRAVQSTPLISRSGRLLGMISTHWRTPHMPAERGLLVLDVLARQVADMMERKQQEEALRGAHAQLSDRAVHLQKLVEERTAKLQELVGELEHFSFTITHDLKSPLRAMRGFAEMMNTMARGEWEQAKETDFVRKISASAERMDRLIADALDYSQAARRELPLEGVDAGALLRGMLESYPELQPQKAQIRVEGELPVVLANQAGLTQVFSNLLGNAVKFVKPGEKAEVRVWAQEVQSGPGGQPPSGVRSEGGWTRIWVEDKGIGISPEAVPHVFDMFWRGNKDYEGTGIGLALVRKVAQRMGGRVGVESEEGKGSRFWIELRYGEARSSGGDTTTVLYVEDNEDDARLVERAFEKMGLAGRLQLVKDGRAAIEYLGGAGRYGDRGRFPIPALVLLDLKLPQVPGFEVLAWIRSHPDYDLVPVVVFSSSALPDDQKRAKELGASEYVTKSSPDGGLAEVLEGLRERWLRRKGI